MNSRRSLSELTAKETNTTNPEYRTRISMSKCPSSIKHVAVVALLVSLAERFLSVSRWILKSQVCKIAIALLLLTTSVLGQTEEQFKQNRLILDFSKLGTGLLPEGLTDARDLAAIKMLRVQAAVDEVQAFQLRYDSGLDNINFLLDAHVKLALAQLDTTNSKEEQLEFIQAGLDAAILTWQRVNELQKVGARGGDYAQEAQARNHVYRFYVWWHKWKAGESIGVTLAR
jgi:hypothetical protein